VTALVIGEYVVLVVLSIAIAVLWIIESRSKTVNSKCKTAGQRPFFLIASVRDLSPAVCVSAQISPWLSD
jgi:hypothetical protein